MKRIINWISARWDQLAVWVVSIWLSLIIVVFAPPVAAGFIGVPFTTHVENPYCKIAVGFVVGIGAYFLLMNLAEVALVLTAVQTKKLVEHFIVRVKENMPNGTEDMDEALACEQY